MKDALSSMSKSTDAGIGVFGSLLHDAEDDKGEAEMKTTPFETFKSMLGQKIASLVSGLATLSVGFVVALGGLTTTLCIT